MGRMAVQFDGQHATAVKVAALSGKYLHRMEHLHKETDKTKPSEVGMPQHKCTRARAGPPGNEPGTCSMP